MIKFDNTAKIALVAAVLFILFGYSVAYSSTQKVLGSIVGQPDSSYGTGNTYSNRGFLIHAVVVAVVMYLVLKYGLKM